MSERNNRKVTYLTDREAAKLSRWASEVDKSESTVLREAIMEYLDHDRTARIEGELKEMHAMLQDVQATLADSDAHTHKADPGMKQGSPAVEKAREIIRRLQGECENPDGILNADAVDRAIEDIAGADTRTLRKYKRIFRRRGLLFCHPGEPTIWSLQSDQWLSWMEDYARLNGADDAEEVADPYPATVIAGMDGKTHIEIAEVEE